MKHKDAVILLLEMSCRFLKGDRPEQITTQFSKAKRKKAKQAVKLIWFRVHEKEMTPEQELIVFGK